MLSESIRAGVGMGLRQLLPAFLCLGVLLGLRAEEPPAKPLTAEQLQRLQERDRLAKEAEKLQQAGKLAEAITALEKKLSIEREVYGRVHTEVAATLTRLARLHAKREDHAQVRRVQQEVLSLQIQLVGKHHWQVTNARLALADAELRAKLDQDQWQRLRKAAQLQQQGGVLYRLGRFADLLPLELQVLQIHKDILGEKHPDYAQSLNNVALLYHRLGSYTQAIALYDQALALHKEILGEKHPVYALSLNNLARLYSDMGSHARADPLIRQALVIRKETLGEKHPDYAASLSSLARLCLRTGDYGQAEPLYRQALALFKEILGEKDSRYTNCLNELALLYHDTGSYAQSETLYRQLLALHKEILGEKHPDYAASLNNLAELYRSMGSYAQAESLYRQAVTLHKMTLGEKHPAYATSLNNLATLYGNMGSYGHAEPLYRQALAIRKETLGEKHPDYAASLNNLAALCQDTGSHAQAEPLFLQALALHKETLGEKHPAYAVSLNNLATLYRSTGNNDQAEPLFRQALALRKEILGEKHPDYAVSLNNLAEMYQSRGSHDQSETLYRQLLALHKEILGEKHPGYAASLNNLATLYRSRGSHAQAESNLHRALAIYEQWVQDSLTALSEQHRIRLLDKSRYSLNGYLSVSLALPVPAERLYRHVLAWKGAVAARLIEERIARDHPELRDLLRQLTQTRARLARLAFAVPPPEHRETWLKQLNDLRTAKDGVESDLARASQAFRQEQQRQRLSPAEVIACLPPETIFLDFLEYTHSSPPAQGKGNFQLEQRLLVFVLRRDHPPVYIPLQAVAPIATAVQTWQQTITTGKGDRSTLQQAAAELSRRVWQPLQPHLGNAKTVLIAPDGVLAQFPFAALPGRQPGSYLLEDVALSYVTSGRHVVEIFSDPARRDGHGLLALGGIDYTANPGKAAPALVAAPRTLQVEAKDRAGFSLLAGTEPEARRCQQLFRQVFNKDRALLLTGAEAHEARVKQECSQRYRYLHLATHGFFESPTRIAALRAGLLAEERGLSRALQDEQERTFALAPLLRSGVVLAGANSPPPAEAVPDPLAEPTGEDGILTAEEVAALDLRGCELAVLSACDTARGNVEKGEGVLGLQRAFQAAGARTLVASLWRVDDAATTVLMEEFYANLWQKKMPKLEALRQAQLLVLRQPERVAQRRKELRAQLRDLVLDEAGPQPPVGNKIQDRSSPLLWAAFVLSGDAR